MQHTQKDLSFLSVGGGRRQQRAGAQPLAQTADVLMKDFKVADMDFYPALRNVDEGSDVYIARP